MKEVILGIILGLIILSLVYFTRQIIKIYKFRKAEREFNKKLDILEKKMKEIAE